MNRGGHYSTERDRGGYDRDEERYKHDHNKDDRYQVTNALLITGEDPWIRIRLS